MNFKWKFDEPLNTYDSPNRSSWSGEKKVSCVYIKSYWEVYKKQCIKQKGWFCFLLSFYPCNVRDPPGRILFWFCDCCIIYEILHIQRWNICWFVKNTNMRSSPSPWHISPSNRKHCHTFNWWVHFPVTQSACFPFLVCLFFFFFINMEEENKKIQETFLQRTQG